MMKKILLTMFACLMATIVFAQNNYEDVVYLKNGSIVRGVIIEQVLNESLKIETADGNLFEYKMDEVIKITKEQKKIISQEIQQIENTLKQKEGLSSTETNFEFVGEYRMFLALGFNSITIFDHHTTYSGGKLEFGYYINPKNLLSVEIGGGNDELENNTYMYFVSWSYIVNLSEKFQWRIGPSLGLLDKEEIETVFAYGGNTGIIWNFSKNKRWFLDLGGRLYGTHSDVGSQISLSIGWRF